MMPEEQKERRVLPQNELDLSLMTINSMWGRDEIPVATQNLIQKYFSIDTGIDGKPSITIKKGWNNLGWMTRDLRLGNLSTGKHPFEDNEVAFVDYHIVLAGDMLEAGMIETFIAIMTRIASKLELSQSKGGFLRKQMNTFTQESIHQETEPPKKSMFGMQKKAER